MHPSLLPVIVGLVITPFTISAPIIEQPLASRQIVNCTDIQAPYDASCWTTLKLSDYLNNTVTGWNHTTKTCTNTSGPGEDGSACCKPGEPWSTCFLRLGTGGTGDFDCSNVNDQTCNSLITENVNPSIAPEVRYILHNIYTINNFFSNWWTAVPSATVKTLLINQPLVNEIDPIQKTNLILDDLLLALTAGLAFIGAPEVGEGISAAVESGAKLLLNGLQQAPLVAKAVWPEGTLDSQSVQLGQLDTDLSELYINTTTAVEAGLFAIMNDLPSFVAFASSGGFSGPDLLSLPDATSALTMAWNTYILSTAMTANKWHSSPFRDMTKADVESNVPGSGGFGCTFDDNNICTNDGGPPFVFYSDSTATAYTLSVEGAGPSPGQLMKDIVTNQWSTLEQLFDGAYNCTVAGNIGKPLNFFNGGTIDLSCMSQLDICLAPPCA